MDTQLHQRQLFKCMSIVEAQLNLSEFASLTVSTGNTVVYSLTDESDSSDCALDSAHTDHCSQYAYGISSDSESSTGSQAQEESGTSSTTPSFVCSPCGSDNDVQADSSPVHLKSPSHKKAKSKHVSEGFVCGQCTEILYEAGSEGECNHVLVKCPCLGHTFHSVKEEADSGRAMVCVCSHSITSHNCGERITPTATIAKPTKLVFKDSNAKQSSKYQGRKKGERPSSKEVADHLMTAESREEAFNTKCTCKGHDCKRNLFTYEGSQHDCHVDGLKATRAEFWQKNEPERGTYVFTQLKLMYKNWDWDGEGLNPTALKSFKFWVNDKPVCLSVWLAMHGISKSLYIRMRKKVVDGGCECT